MLNVRPVSEKIHPDDNMFKVMRANGNQDGYFLSGERNTLVFRRLVDQLDPSLSSGKRIMDYGCGHGRMTRHIPKVFSPSVLVAADVLESGVKFCAEEFGTVPFVVSQANPIANYTGTCDVIISVSVFTHLPMNLLEINMAGLAKVLDERGLLLFTANGTEFLERTGATLTDGFYFGNLSKGKATRLPKDEYGQACVSPVFMKALLERVGLKLVDHVPQGHVGRQDIYVARH